MNLKIVMTRGESPIQTDGDIYSDPYTVDDLPPLVSDVFVRRTRESRFVLDKGKYQYRFVIQNKDGEIELEAVDEATGNSVASKKFHTKHGHIARLFKFEVK